MKDSFGNIKHYLLQPITLNVDFCFQREKFKINIDVKKVAVEICPTQIDEMNNFI